MTNPTPYFQPLFDLMSLEHGLTLLDSEMNDICEVVMKIKGEQMKLDAFKAGMTVSAQIAHSADNYTAATIAIINYRESITHLPS